MTTSEANLAIAGVSLAVGGLIAWVITHLYHLKDKKDSDQLNESLRQQIEQMGKDFKKALNALSEDVKKYQSAMFKTIWKGKYPDQPIPQQVLSILTDVVESIGTSVETIATAFEKKYDYTANGGIKLGGAAETILGGPEGDIPPINR